VSHLRNLEYLLVAGSRDLVTHMTAPYQEAAALALPLIQNRRSG